jgi:hypothetical protein
MIESVLGSEEKRGKWSPKITIIDYNDKITLKNDDKIKTVMVKLIVITNLFENNYNEN